MHPSPSWKMPRTSSPSLRRASGSDRMAPDGRTTYVSESVGLAAGILITGLHHAGLATLTHTPSPMRFLDEILGRPARERPFLLVVVGYPEKGIRVPVDAARKKAFPEICTIVDG